MEKLTQSKNKDCRGKALLKPVDVAGGDIGEYPITKSVLSVGRHASADLHLPMSSVSRRHARLLYEDRKFILEDLQSRNGTYVNKNLITKTALNEGDVISFGSVQFKFSITEGGMNEEDKKKTTVRIVTEKDHTSSTVRKQSTLKPDSTGTVRKESIEKAHRRLATIYRLSEILRKEKNKNSMMQQVIDLIFDVLPADRGVIISREREEGVSGLKPMVVKNKDGASPVGDILISRTIVDKCMNERLAILSSNTPEDRRFDGSESVVQLEIRSAICTPLIVRNKVQGILHIDSRESAYAFNEDDLAFVSSIVNELSLSLENLQLTEEMILTERMAAIGQTITGVAHNIKNVLQLIQGGLDLFDSNIEHNRVDRLKTNWNIIRKGLDRIGKITHDMLDYAKNRRPEKKYYNINTLIGEVIESTRQTLQDKQIEVLLSLDPDLSDSYLDIDGMYECIVNLVNNAIDAIEGKGEIFVSTYYTRDGSLNIEVRDTGAGFIPELADKIFEPFVTSKGTEGTGLGLASTKKIIEEMGGKIFAEGKKRVGAKFTITLPYVPPPTNKL